MGIDDKFQGVDPKPQVRVHEEALHSAKPTSSGPTIRNKAEELLPIQPLLQATTLAAATTAPSATVVLAAIRTPPASEMIRWRGEEE